MVELRTSEVNIGGDAGKFVEHCGHCSKSYPTTDDQGRPVGKQALCVRCGCPMDSNESSLIFGDQKATDEHKPSLAVMGGRTRAMNAPPAHAAIVGNASSVNK